MAVFSGMGEANPDLQCVLPDLVRRVWPVPSGGGRNNFQVWPRLPSIWCLGSYVDHEEWQSCNGACGDMCWIEGVTTGIANADVAKFEAWFKEQIRNNSLPSGIANANLIYALAVAPTCIAATHQSYNINGYTFYKDAKDKDSDYQNSG